MKTSFLSPIFIRQFCRLGVFAGLIFLPGAVRVAEAQFSLTGGTNQYNIFTYDGATATGTGTDPAAQGTPLSSFQFMPSGTTIPGSALFSYSASGVSVNFSGTDPTANGTTLSLTYSGTGQDELRLDWMATYVNSSGISQTIPSAFLINVTASSSTTYSAVAGQETFYYGGNTATATIQNNGFNAGSYSLVNGPWAGWTGPFSGSVSPAIAGSLTIPNSQGFEVNGYLDLVVDPGTFQIQIEPAPEPGALALSLMSGLGLLIKLRRRNCN